MKSSLVSLLPLLFLVGDVGSFSVQGRTALQTTMGPLFATGTTTQLCALEVEATCEVVGGHGRMGSLFLRQEGAIAVPRGVASGCLTSNDDAPIIVAIPSKDWRDIHQFTLPHRQSDLVWVGNGLLSDWQQNATVVLPHFGVLKVGADPVTSPESPPTYIYGKHAVSMVEILTKQGVQVVVESSWTKMRILAARKLLWASCMWLLCHDNGSDPPLTVKQVHEVKQDEVDRLVTELLPSLISLTGSNDGDSTILVEEVMSYMKAYSLSMSQAIPSMDLAMAELKDRNGVFVASHQQFHRELLERVTGSEAAVDLLLQQATAGQSGDVAALDNPAKLVSMPAIDLVCCGEMISTDCPVESVIVVGGGIIGSSIARALVQRGVKEVTVYDPTPTGKTTPASWAWLNANQKPPHAYKSLNQLGLRAWRSDSLVSSLPLWSGTLVCTKEKLELNGGYTVEGPLSKDRIRELEVEANFTDTGYVYYFADEGHVNPHHAVLALRQEAMDKGASFLPNQRVVGLVRDPDGTVVGVKACSGDGTAETEQLADVVVVAAGVNSSDTALGGVPLVHNPSRTFFASRCSTTTTASSSPAASSLTRILMDQVRSLYIAQRKDGAFVAGAGALKFGLSATFDGAKLSSEDVQKQMAVAQQLAQPLAPGPLGDATFTHKEEAVKPMPQDGYPIVGYLEAGLYSAVTHSGMTMAPLLGPLVAAELKEQVSFNLLDNYRPGRFDKE